MKQWTYGMRHRGYSIGCQPMDGLVERKDSKNNKYYDILVYSRRLTGREVYTYELDFLGVEDSKEYVNRNTGEVTSIHGLAMAWYRNGDAVDIYRDGKFIMGWYL